jgi:hypothetical protein
MCEGGVVVEEVGVASTLECGIIKLVWVKTFHKSQNETKEGL